jgi:hypothetical protein
MKLPHRRQFLHLAAGAAALPAISRIARAQVYPTRPVRLIVPFGPAGASDFTARLMGSARTFFPKDHYGCRLQRKGLLSCPSKPRQ